MNKIIIAASVLMAYASATHAANLFVMPDGSMDSMPTKGMQIYEPPATKGNAAIAISTDNPAHGTGALKVECESGIYVSISFPMNNAIKTGRASVYLRGAISNAETVTVGLQSFTMDGGFKSVDFVPVMDAKNRIGTDWQKFTFDLERDSRATHWQLSFILKGPGILWIDQLEEIK
ncbi:MAG TPA: hypothetical protein PKE26_00725 [Kiritimatiellia bacterium]|nr:hypothetical protein [Kiritimatiellia bacterium]HMO97616.1 hypothetical protein [Kiritimatiellia bacterium]HMP95976.1 hypothetical protein [Kiritimatiellia bacterium]